MDKHITGNSSVLAEVMEYKGAWNASTNSPTLANTDTDVNGNAYRVSVAGSQDLGAGSVSYQVGDMVVNNGSVWEHFDSNMTDAEIETAINNQLTGTVVGTSDAQTLTNKSIDSDNNTITNISNGAIKAGAGITFSKLENVANDRILGRVTAGSGVTEELTASQVRTLINVEDGATADQSDSEIETAYNNQVAIATQGEAEAGTLTSVKRFTPERIKQAIAALQAVDSVAGQTGAVTLDHEDITDFDAGVQANRLDQMAAPTGSVSLNSQKITSLLDPTANQEAATKKYVDDEIAGVGGFWDGSSTLATTESTSSTSFVDTALTASLSAGTYIWKIDGFWDQGGSSDGHYLGMAYTGTVTRFGAVAVHENGESRSNDITSSTGIGTIFGATEGYVIFGSGLIKVSDSGTFKVRLRVNASDTNFLREGSTLYWKKVI